MTESSREKIYIERQLEGINPSIADNDYRIKIVALTGQTHWLSITHDKLIKIAEVLKGES